MTIFRFAEAMSEELANNRDKGGWDGCTYGYLLRRAKQELAELSRAIDANKDADEILSEAADVANFCYMIADLYATRKEHEAFEAANVRASL